MLRENTLTAPGPVGVGRGGSRERGEEEKKGEERKGKGEEKEEG